MYSFIFILHLNRHTCMVVESHSRRSTRGLFKNTILLPKICNVEYKKNKSFRYPYFSCLMLVPRDIMVQVAGYLSNVITKICKTTESRKDLENKQEYMTTYQGMNSLES